MVRTRHRNDVSDEAVVQSASQTEKVSLLWDYGGSCYKGRETEEAGRSFNFDNENLLQEVKNMKDDEKVSWFSVWCIGGLFPERNIKLYRFKMPLGTMTQHVWEPAPYWGMEEKIIATEAV